MTPNKPYVEAYVVTRIKGQGYGKPRRVIDAKVYDATSDSFFAEGARENSIVEPLIPLSTYEALQAECEKLRKDAERYRWQAARVAPAVQRKPLGYVVRRKAELLRKGELWGISLLDQPEDGHTLPVYTALQPGEQQPDAALLEAFDAGRRTVQTDVALLAEALEQVIRAAPSGGPLWHGSEQIVEARAALAAYRKQRDGAWTSTS